MPVGIVELPNAFMLWSPSWCEIRYVNTHYRSLSELVNAGDGGSVAEQSLASPISRKSIARRQPCSMRFHGLFRHQLIVRTVANSVLFPTKCVTSSDIHDRCFSMFGGFRMNQVAWLYKARQELSIKCIVHKFGIFGLLRFAEIRC